jgi:hypothetical protein
MHGVTCNCTPRYTCCLPNDRSLISPLCYVCDRRERARSERPGGGETRHATKAPAELSPVHLVLELPGGSVCAHDFKASALCELPVKVVLRNSSRIFSVSLCPLFVSAPLSCLRLTVSRYGLTDKDQSRCIAEHSGYRRCTRLHVGWDYSTEGRTRAG